ncbi:MAG: hypothetical protein ACX93N_12785 [Pseudohaliea sp.]
MKTTKLFAALVAGALGGTLAAGAIAEAPATGETVTVWAVDHSGRPPFKRERVEVPVVDTARLELADESVETVTVWTVDRSGKPPYQRRREELPVTDIAALESAPAEEEPLFRGRPPFKRHR